MNAPRVTNPLDVLQGNFLAAIMGVVAHRPSILHQSGFRNRYARDAYAREFCTVRLSLPRRMGNSNLAARLLTWSDDTLLVVNTRNTAESTLQYMPREQRLGQERILTIHQGPRAFRGRTTSLLVADLPATSYTLANLDTIYMAHAEFYVLLG